MSKNLSTRHRAERRFIAYGFISLILAAFLTFFDQFSTVL